MIDYLSYPKASLERVLPPQFQIVGHRFNNIAFGIPRQLLSRYHRPASGTRHRDWWLPSADPQWDELLPYQQALALYSPKAPAKPREQIERERAQEQHRIALESYWAMVRKLPGTDDPLWRYGSESAEDVDDYRWQLRDDSKPQIKPWFPRIQLRLKYGTTSLQEYAAQHGVHFPD